MALELQNPVQDFFQGRSPELPVGYKKLYPTWEASAPNAAVLSNPEKVESFAQHVEATVLDRLTALIKTQNPDPAAQIPLLRLAQRGQLLLASRDQGQHFDAILKPEDLPGTNPNDVTLLSSSLISQTNDLQQVLDHQVARHAVQVLKASGFEFDSVQSIHIQGAQVMVELDHHPKYKEIRVDLRKDAQEPLDYAYIELSGQESHFPETQLPEQHGQVESPQIEPDQAAAALDYQSRQEELIGQKNALMATNAASAAASTLSAADSLRNARELEAFQTPQPIPHVDVQQAKAKLQERQEQQKQRKDRTDFNPEEEAPQAKRPQTRASEATQAPARSGGISGGNAWALGALGATGLMAGAGTGATLFITLFT